MLIKPSLTLVDDDDDAVEDAADDEFGDVDNVVDAAMSDVRCQMSDDGGCY